MTHHEEHEIPEDLGETGTRRATGMGNPGTFESDKPGARARRATSGKLEETADRVRRLGDRASEKNRVLGYTRPIAYQAAEGIDGAASYVRSRELGEMKADLETQVRRHPLAAIAVAFLAGYTLRRIF